jgi:hypothetical protein
VPETYGDEKLSGARVSPAATGKDQEFAHETGTDEAYLAVEQYYGLATDLFDWTADPHLAVRARLHKADLHQVAARRRMGTSVAEIVGNANWRILAKRSKPSATFRSGCE